MFSLSVVFLTNTLLNQGPFPSDIIGWYDWLQSLIDDILIDDPVADTFYDRCRLLVDSLLVSCILFYIF